jgi:hypothetical protein
MLQEKLDPSGGRMSSDEMFSTVGLLGAQWVMGPQFASRRMIGLVLF